MKIRGFPGASVAVLVLALPLLAAAAASTSERATDCVEGPADLAGIDRPHVVDDLDDAALGAASVDVTAMWMSRQEGPPWADMRDDSWLLDGGLTVEWWWAPHAFSVHVAVADLADPLPSVRHVVEVVHSEGSNFFAAEHTPDGRWRYLHGRVEDGPAGPIFAEEGPTTGTEDVEAGTLEIDMVGAFQLPPEHGGAENVELRYLGTYLPVGGHLGTAVAPREALPRSGVAQYELDSGDNSENCTVWLHPEDDDSADD